MTDRTGTTRGTADAARDTVVTPRSAADTARGAACTPDWALNLLALALVVADQGVKWLVQATMTPHQSYPLLGDLLRLTFVHNTGAAFGILQRQRFFLLGVTFLAIGAMLWYRRTLPRTDWLPRLGLSCIVGGAIGNFIDRVRFGLVIDYIDVDLPDLVLGPVRLFGRSFSFACERWPAFNVADAAISVGLVLLVWHLWQTDDTTATGDSAATGTPSGKES